MGKTLETIKTVNSAARTGLAIVAVGLLGSGGYWGYSEYTKRDRELLASSEALETAKGELTAVRTNLSLRESEIASLKQDLAKKVEQIQRLETSIRLLKIDQRLAQLEVVKQAKNEASGRVESTIRFTELSPDGDPISKPRDFTLQGDVIYIDNWIVKFDDKFVESADLERGTSLCLFRRIFGESQTPLDGFPLDEVGMRPQAYASGGQLTEFESKIWKDFWEFANNPRAAAELGIRAANGEAVSIQVREGMKYSIVLRASGGLSITPIIPPGS